MSEGGLVRAPALNPPFIVAGIACLIATGLALMLKAPKRAWRVESNSFRKEEAVAEAKVIIVRREKSRGPAYLLLIFLGQLGIHRFYLGKVGSGIAQLLLFVLGLATMLSRIGPILLVILWIWLLIDLFLTASMVRKVNAALYGDGAA